MRIATLMGVVWGGLMLVSGCAEYATPSRGADMSAMGVRPGADQTDPSIAASLAKRPLAQFPTAIAVARIESPNYRTPTAQGWGAGRYSVVTTRDIEDPKVFDDMQKLPQIEGIVPIGRLLLPGRLETDYELRDAAAKLHADMLLVYTLDTTFSQHESLAPLGLVTLGLAPDQEIRVTTTASAVLMDTHNGYIYGVCEDSVQSEAIALAWNAEATSDAVRRRTEAEAFEKMAGHFKGTWEAVLKQQHVAEGAAKPGAHTQGG